MSTITYNHPTAINYRGTAKPGFLTKFMSWCQGQEENRLMWLGLGLSIHGCIITPIAVLAILILSPVIEMALLTLVIIAMTMVLVVNLAALSTKVTIPVFFASVLIDLVIIGAVML